MRLTRDSLQMIHLLRMFGCFTVLCSGLLFFTQAVIAHELSRQSAVVEVVRQAGPAVVNIRTEQIVQRSGSPVFGFGNSLFEQFFSGFGTPRIYKTQSLGSGVLIDARGYVLTNAHVVEQASKIFVALDGRQKEIEATLVGMHKRLDLAVIKIEGDEPFPFLAMGSSSDLLLGETVIAIGNPLGLDNSVTTGVVSSTHRRVPMAGGQIGHFIQTDALINPGNSDSGKIGMPSGYSTPDSSAGYLRPSMLGIWVAVNAITS